MPGKFYAVNAILPIHSNRTDNGKEPYVHADLVVITRGGIHILQILRRGGSIIAPRDGKWTRRSKDGQAEEFPSPILSGALAASAVKRILRIEQIPNIPVSFHVITTANHVRFSEEYDEITPVTDLLPMLRNQDKSRFLSLKEIRLCQKAMNKHIRH